MSFKFIISKNKNQSLVHPFESLLWVTSPPSAGPAASPPVDMLAAPSPSALLHCWTPTPPKILIRNRFKEVKSAMSLNKTCINNQIISHELVWSKGRKNMRLTGSSVPIGPGLFQLLLQFPTLLLAWTLQVGQSVQWLLQLGLDFGQSFLGFSESAVLLAEGSLGADKFRLGCTQLVLGLRQCCLEDWVSAFSILVPL